MRDNIHKCSNNISDGDVKMTSTFNLTADLSFKDTSTAEIANISQLGDISAARYAGLASYIIFKDGTTICAKNGVTGKIDYFGADAAVVIQQCVTALTTGTIFFCPGVYTMNATIDVTVDTKHIFTAINCQSKNVMFQGSGIGQTIFRMADSQNYASHSTMLLYYRTYTGGGVRDISFDGNRANQDYYYWDGAALLLTQGARSGGVFQNLSFVDSIGNGMYLGNGGGGNEINAMVDNISVKNCGRCGIEFDMVQNSCVSNIYVESSGDLTPDTTQPGIVTDGNTNWATRDDNTSYSNVNLVDCALYMFRGAEITFNGLRIFAPAIPTTSYTMFIQDCRKISMGLVEIVGTPTNDYRTIYTLGASVCLFGGRIDGNRPISVATGGEVTITGTEIHGWACLNVANDGILNVNGCMVYPEDTGYTWLASETSTLRLNGVIVKAFTGAGVSGAYKAAGATVIHVGTKGAGTANKGTSTGTGSQQTIAHLLAAIPTDVTLSEYNTGAAVPYQSAAADATNIYVTATNAKTYTWRAEV